MEQISASSVTRTFSGAQQTDPTGDPRSTPSTETSAQSAPYFNEALHDAERLLKYAAESGTHVRSDIRTHILRARISPKTEKSTADLLTALTLLSKQLKPVTAASLKATSMDGRTDIGGYKWVAIILALVIVPFSIASFVSSSLSDAIRQEILTANELSVQIVGKLRPQGPGTTSATRAQSERELPPGVSLTQVITDLQQFASIIRSIDGRTRRLNSFVLKLEPDPYADRRPDPQKVHQTFQLPVNLPDHLSDAFDERLAVYQNVRYFAQSVLDDLTFYGAITTCILPVLYALLGTCAYLLRTFEQQWSAKTYIPSVAHSARFLIAGIGGGVVGLFNNLTITKEATIPPLAIAFLVGYAVDVFFAFLESLLQAFTRSSGAGVSDTQTNAAASSQNSGAPPDGEEASTGLQREDEERKDHIQSSKDSKGSEADQ